MKKKLVMSKKSCNFAVGNERETNMISDPKLGV